MVSNIFRKPRISSVSLVNCVVVHSIAQFPIPVYIISTSIVCLQPRVDRNGTISNKIKMDENNKAIKKPEKDKKPNGSPIEPIQLPASFKDSFKLTKVRYLAHMQPTCYSNECPHEVRTDIMLLILLIFCHIILLLKLCT